MGDPIPKTPAGTAAPGPVAPAVAGVGPAKPAGAVAASPHARLTATQAGGLPGGKQRKDGLIPGTEKALEADRKKDAARKQITRERQRQAIDPPPIPSAYDPGQAPPGRVVPLASPGDVPPVAWDPAMLKPLFEQLVPTVETLMVNQIADRAEKAHMPGAIINDFKRDAAWNPVAKQAINIAAPQVAAKWLNKSGVSAEHQPEIVLGTAVCSLVAGHILLLRRMDELIRKTNPPATQLANVKVGNETYQTN